eukprot:TRINITY_DN428_c0_g1_i1.p1 TRINITY_DN428_c0_g1~~TRINITY_DN428_c0_g1_i1.p1  ORF type:complete len:325 (-),score=117.20 TRINITY_DN428_c0_g1_i1:169-1014(-)
MFGVGAGSPCREQHRRSHVPSASTRAEQRKRRAQDEMEQREAEAMRARKMREAQAHAQMPMEVEEDDATEYTSPPRTHCARRQRSPWEALAEEDARRRALEERRSHGVPPASRKQQRADALALRRAREEQHVRRKGGMREGGKRQQAAEEQKQQKRRVEEERRRKQAEADERAREEQSATVIQSAFRGHMVRKQEVLPQLRKVAAVRRRVDEIVEEFLEMLEHAADERRQRVLAGLEDALTREGLLAMDSISTNGSDVVRAARKSTVVYIQELIDEVEAMQ